ncbi:MAG: UPF0182 family protein [Deltaproteobacteria bacterium]|nr:UPF0182 family protein [Deltaproteobacteria bacterium]
MSRKKRQTSTKGRLGLFVILVVLTVLGLPILAHLYIDLRWFRSIRLESIFTTILATRLMIGGSIFIVSAAFLLANLHIALHLSRNLPSLFIHDPEGIARVDLGSLFKRVTLPLGLGFAVIAAFISQHHWDIYLRFIHASSFGLKDPIFGHDIGLYVFRLPLFESLSSLFLWNIGIASVAVFALFWARGAISLSSGLVTFHQAARTHLSILGALLFLGLAFEGYLDLLRILYSTTGPMAGASYTDVYAAIPGLRVKIAIAAIAAVLFAATIMRETVYFALAAIGLYVGVHLIGIEFYPAIVQRFSVIPNELEKETPFLQNNIAATRHAYGLDAIAERDLSGKVSLEYEDIIRNQDTIENIRLWDHQPLLDTFAQIQEIRTYYDFYSVDNDRYLIDGKLKQTMLSPRELSSDSLPNRTWINERFTFTHGYGLTLGPVNEATAEGLPVLLIQDIPPSAVHASLKVTQPAIYFGELSNDYVFVKTHNREFHHPSTEGNVYKDYDGKGGIRVDSILTRFALALRLGALKLLFSEDITSDSRVLIYRRIHDRVRRVAPFLRYDNDPYMVVRDDGTLVWIQDAYCVSDRYPYAEPSREGYNYIRNSVKVVVDAYNGSVALYIADSVDPILRTWRGIFPKVFLPLDRMPSDIRAHLRYPEDIFKIQTEMFTVYHMNNAQLLYNREDQWEKPTINAVDTDMRMEPYYMIMKLPEERRAEFILMLPFTPKRKDNLAAWMVARANQNTDKSLIVYRFPKDRLVFGPKQIINRINQDAEISRQISLWDQRGSEALFGTLLVIPVEESLIYVRPLYLRSEGGKIPELKRVIVVYENRIAMAPSLKQSMDEIFKRSTETTMAEELATSMKETETQPARSTEQPRLQSELPDEKLSEDPRVRALYHFQRAVAAQRAGDWTSYGSELTQVENYLRKMQPKKSP